MLDLSEVQKSRYEHKRERERNVAKMRKVIDLWPKEELLAYVSDRNKKHPVSDGGMGAILERFIQKNELHVGSLSEDLKLAFDIVLAISRNKKIYLQTTDQIMEFTKHYKEVIKHYDRQSAQTYYHKLAQAYEKSVSMVKKKLKIEQEMRLKY